MAQDKEVSYGITVNILLICDNIDWRSDWDTWIYIEQVERSIGRGWSFRYMCRLRISATIP